MKTHHPRGLCLRGYRKVLAECGKRFPATCFRLRGATCRTCRRVVKANAKVSA